MIELMRFLSALVLTYAASRALWRVPSRTEGSGRLAAVHAVSAALLGALFATLAQAIEPLVTVGVAQGCWFLLDLARGRATMRGGRPARS